MVKHDTHWQATRLPDGTIDWTGPTGHHHLVPPATYPVNHTLDMCVSDDNTESAIDVGEPEADDSDGGTEGKRAA